MLLRNEERQMKTFFAAFRTIVLAMTIFALGSAIRAQGQSGVCADEGQTCVIATHITNASAPFMDGDLSDAVWQNAGVLNFPNGAGGTFIIPDHAPATFRLYFLHDDINLY